MTDRDTSRDVAIIGMACRFAEADGVDEFWTNLVDGRQCFGPIPEDRWNHDAFLTERFRENDKTYVTRGAFIDDVDSFGALHFKIAPRRVEVMDPQHRMVLEATRVALLDAGIEQRDEDLETMGTFLGVSTSEYRNIITSRTLATLMATGQFGDDAGVGDALSRSVENVAPISAFSMPGTLLNMAAANVANHWKLGGPAYTVDAACASSLLAVHDAVTHIRAGICRTAVAGGVYVNLTPEAIIGFSRIGAISQKGSCRPFDAEADGFLQGDGCGVVVLKRFDDAVADGDRIYATICGTGVNNDAGASSGPMAPSLDGQAGAMRSAYRDAGVDPRSVGFVSCHGTATPVGDPVEVGSLRAVLAEAGESTHPVMLGSAKANIGHTMSAAGVAGLIHATLSLHHECITPQAGFESPHPALGLEDPSIAVPTELTQWTRGSAPRRAGVSAFGFGGTNCHLVLEEAPAAAATLPATGPETVVLHADSRELLAEYAERLAAQIEPGGDLRAIAYTLSATRKRGPSRLAVVAADTSELAGALHRAGAQLRGDAPGPILGPDAFFGEGDAPKLAFMFPGQGAQRVGLFADLVERYPLFASHLDRLGAASESIVGATIRELLYPAVEDEDAMARLTSTQVCQPVMAAVGLALSNFLRDLGVEPSVCLGHSLGEFVAAAAGGMLSDEAAVRFVAERGRLMADLDLADTGSMVAVMAGADVVRPHLVDGAQIANLNHPQQTVISGSTAAIAKVSAALQEAGLKATSLSVSHAFHCEVVSSVKAALADVVDALELTESDRPVFSAITASEYRDVASTRATFVEHTTSAVDFMGALEAASATGANLFVEVGAGTTLSTFAQGTLADAQVVSRSLGARKPDGGRDFQRALALLAASGVDVDFEKLHPQRLVTSLVAPPLARSKHWAIREKAVPLAVPGASKRGKTLSNNDTSNPSDDLVALFREQNEILRQHAAIMAAQNVALSNQGISIPDMPQVLEPVAAVPQPQAIEPEPEPSNPVSEDYSAMVREAVAAVSAFPSDALSDQQQLATELGFDSLMFVDLATELQKRVPGLEIPQTAFDQSTTVGDVIVFLQDNAGEDDRSGDAGIISQDSELHRFELQWQPVLSGQLRGEAFAPKGIVAITMHGVDEQAVLFAQGLEARGVQTRLIDVDDNNVELSDATALVDFAHRRLSWSTEHIVTLRKLAAALMGHGVPAAFVTVTSPDADAATRGAIRGFTKALSREWASTRVLNAELDGDVATTLLAELDEPAHHIEVRYKSGLREVPRPLLNDAEPSGLALGPRDLIVVTGGARGIGRACARALLKRTKAKLLLVGRKPHVDISEFGARASYLQWDVATARPDAFGKLKPTMIVHAAGVIRDSAVEKKTDADVRVVLGAKVDGLLNVLAAAGSRVKTVVGFGSWAGRFGNVHQTDYSAANDAMTEVLRELGDRGVHAVNIDWPVWQDSAMGNSIPGALQEAMRARGVTFLTEEEGVTAFMAELGRSTNGEVILARRLPGREVPYRAAFEASLETMPYVGDHVVRGVPIVPFASALDWLATAAAVSGDAQGPIVLRDVKLFKGVDLSSSVAATLSCDIERGRGTAEAHADGTLAYRANVEILPDAQALEALVPELVGDSVTPKLDLKRFYAEFAFHGPRIRAITKLEGISPEWIVGIVKTSTPDQLLGGDSRDSWTVDPLVVDGSMQLVLYHLQSLHGFGAIPMAIDEYVQIRPFEGEWVRCSMALDDMSNGNIVGTIAFEDERGLAAVMTRLRAKEFQPDTRADEVEVDIDPQFWDIAEFPEVQELEQRLQMADLMGIRNPYFWPHDGPARNTAIVDGHEMINYSSYNYCGFSGHPEVSKAAQDAIARYGTSVSASRIASGQIPLHQELEDAIASFVGTEATLVFAAGHMTNETVIGHLFGKRDLIIHDELAHNSILTGAELSGAKRMQFPHSDWEALDRVLTQLRGNYEKVGIFIEGVYSMDGDIPDLPRFIEVKRKHKCLLYVDEAHSLGVIGPRGAGISDYYGVDSMDVDVWMGTLSKSFASCGGFITGSKKLIEYLKYTTPAFVFSAGISPANAAAALASCKLLAAHPEIPQQLQAVSRRFIELCQQKGIDTGMSKDSAVVPAIVGNSIDSLRLSGMLAERGINVQPIVYPAVEDESSRLRFFLSAVHTEENLRQTVEILAEELHNVRSGAAAE